MSDLDRAGRSPLHYAALDGDADRVTQLIAAGWDVNQSDVDGFTPLHFAAQSHALEATNVLLDHGAHLDAVNRFGNSPLLVAMTASAGRRAEIILLRDRGADPNLKNRTGVSAVDLARIVTNFDFSDLFPEAPGRTSN